MKKIINFLKNESVKTGIFYSVIIIMIYVILYNVIVGYIHTKELLSLENSGYYVISKKYKLSGYLIGTNLNNPGHTVMFYFNPKELKYDIFGDPDCKGCYPNGKQSPFGQEDTYYTESGLHQIKIYKNCNILADEGIFNAIHNPNDCFFCLYRNGGEVPEGYMHRITYDIRHKKEEN